MANKKMTMVEKFDAVKALLMGETPAVPFTIEDAVAFMDDRKAQTVKKNASGGSADRKPTKEQIANEGIKAQIAEVLGNASAPMTIGELMKALGIESNQKVTSLITQMLTERKGVPNPEGIVVRTEVKGKAHFALATPSAE